MLLRLSINVNRNVALQRTRIEIAMFKPIAAGKCSLRLLDTRWALITGFRKAAWNSQKTIGKPLGNS
jgi:hypothetical protein